MRLRNTIISAGVALLFFSAFAQEPSPLRPAPARPRQDTVQGDTVAKPRGERTIVNIKSKRMFPIQIGGDSTVQAMWWPTTTGPSCFATVPCVTMRTG